MSPSVCRLPHFWDAASSAQLHLKDIAGASSTPRLPDAGTALLDVCLPGDSFLFAGWGRVIPESDLRKQLDQFASDYEWAGITVLDFSRKAPSEKKAAKYILAFLRETGHLPSAPKWERVVR